jgi:hypothetical protein
MAKLGIPGMTVAALGKRSNMCRPAADYCCAASSWLVLQTVRLVCKVTDGVTKVVVKVARAAVLELKAFDVALLF